MEAEWDPNGTWEEHGSFRERNNRRAYIEIDIPAFTTQSNQEACDSYTDCSDWQSQPSFIQDFCRDHLRCETNSDCNNLYGGPCVEVSGETDKFCEI